LGADARRAPLTPFAIEPTDRVIRTGTGEHWRDFLRTKERLK
jgi:hypothetical protein